MIAIDATWWGGLLAALCVGVAAVFLAHGVRQRADRGVSLAHALTGLAMAGMFSPWGDPVPAGPGAALFAVLAAWTGVRTLRGLTPQRTGAHLVIASAAMVLMYLLRPADAGHAAHGDAPGLAGLLAVALALLSAGYFGWHAWTCAERARPAPARPGAPAVSALRTEPAAHVVMSGLMAAMFLTAL